MGSRAYRVDFSRTTQVCSLRRPADESLDVMPKMKSNSGAKKRFKTTGSGRLKRAKAFANHILTKKSQKRKRNLRKKTLVNAVDEPRMKRMISS